MKLHTFLFRTFKYGFRYLFDKKYRKVINRRIKDKRRRERLSNRYKYIRVKFRKTHLKGKTYAGCNICHIWHKVSELEIDHIIPVHRGGENERHNLQIICKTCHKKKTKAEEPVDNFLGTV